MNLSDELKEKINILKRESSKVEEFTNFQIFDLDALERGQVGYSIDSEGNSLVDNQEGSWKTEWLVIGYETLCGDPIIIEINEPEYPVSLLMHGMGNWDGGSYISDSIEHFTKEISRISDFIYEKSIKRSNPRISCEDLDNLVREIIKVDECGDIDIWRSMLEPIYDSTKEYEDTLSKKVKE